MIYKEFCGSWCAVNLKDLDIYIPLLTGKPEQQWFTIQSGILSSISTLAVGSTVQL